MADDIAYCVGPAKIDWADRERSFAADEELDSATEVLLHGVKPVRWNQEEIVFVVFIFFD